MFAYFKENLRRKLSKLLCVGVKSPIMKMTESEDKKGNEKKENESILDKVSSISQSGVDFELI